MNDIYMVIIVECGMKLSNDLSIPIILEPHQVLHLKLVNHLKHFLYLCLVKVLKVLPVHPLHLSDSWLAQTHKLVEGVMEQRPKPLIYACMLGLRVWIFFPGKLDQNRYSFITLVLQLQGIAIFGGRPLLGKEWIVH
jgi:hypothetical protein